MSGTGIERQIRRARAHRVIAEAAALVNVFMLALSLAFGRGLLLAVFLAVLVHVILAVIVMQTRMIATLERARELNRHAGRLEFGPGPCAHASAESVDLFNPVTGEYDGERVGWVCPDCNAGLPAGWTPGKRVLRSGTGGTVTVHFTGCPAPVAALGGGGGSGEVVPVYVPESAAPVASYALARTDSEITAARAADHFEALAKVGLEHCLSYCPICAERDEREAPGGPALDFLREHEARMRSMILAPKPDIGDARRDLARDMRDLADLERIGASAPVSWCQEHMCAVTDCPPFPDLPPDESEQR